MNVDYRFDTQFSHMNRVHFWTLFLFFAVLFSFIPFSTTHSIAQATLYQPGQTLNPACAPTDAGCNVIPPATAGVNTDITELGGLTHVTSTNAVFTYVSSTQLYVNGLLFESMNGVSITSTNAFFTGLTFGTATGTAVTTVDLASTGLSTLATTTIMNGYLGIGTTTPQAPLHLTSGSFLQTVGSDPTVLGSIGLPGNTIDVSVVGNYAYVLTGGLSGRLYIIDITNPLDLKEIGFIETSYMFSDMYVAGGYVYISSGDPDESFFVVDISNPTEPSIISNTLVLGDSYTRLDLSGNLAYVAGSNSKFSVIDVSNPKNLTRVDDITVSSQYIRGLDVFGNYAYVGTDNSVDEEFHIIDISDSSNLSVVGSLELSTNVTDVYVLGGYAYISSYNGGVSQIFIVDISNSSSPTVVSSLETSYIVESIFVSGNYVYAVGASNIITIINITDRLNPSIVSNGLQINFISALNKIFISGKYAYVSGVLSGTDDIFVIDLTGIEAPSAHIGSLQSDNMSIVNNLSIGNGLVVGSGGILSYGGFSFSNPSSTSYIGGSLIFGNAALDTNVILQLPNDVSSTAKAYLWDTYSDARIKTNQVSLEYGLSEILRLQPKRYTQKNSYWDNGELILSGGNNTFGLIAQEVYEVLPELVSRPSDETRGLWGLDYSKLGPVLVRAIQEQQDQIDGLHFYLTGISTSSPSIVSEEELLFANNKPITSAITYLSNRLLSGAIILKDFMTERVTAVVGVFHRVRTESIEMTDEETGELYCITIKQGEWHKRQGGCATDVSDGSALLGEKIVSDTEEEIVMEDTSAASTSPSDDVITTNDTVDVVVEDNESTQDDETSQFISELVEKIKQNAEDTVIADTVEE